MINLDTQREAVTKAAKVLTESTVSAGTKVKELGVTTVKTVNDSPAASKVKELGTSATTTATDTAKTILARIQSATEKSIDTVGSLPLGDKKVAERAKETVSTVQDKIDVEQIQDQVAKLRDQIENVLGAWKESFRPSSPVEETPSPAEKPAKKAPAAKTSTAKKAPAAKTSTAKKAPAAKTSTAKKATSTATATSKSAKKSSSTK